MTFPQPPRGPDPGYVLILAVALAAVFIALYVVLLSATWQIAGEPRGS